jgi:hypothetical protein
LKLLRLLSFNMSTLAVLDEFLDPLIRCLNAASALRIISLPVSQEAQQTIARWAELANEGSLNEKERADYEALISAAEFVSILKLKANRLLAENS